MDVRFEPDAAEELSEATTYYSMRSVQVAERFLTDVDGAIDLLLRFPGAGAPLSGNLRRLPLKVFPYRLIYRIQGEEIRIYAVAHVRRKPGYWRRRVSS